MRQVKRDKLNRKISFDKTMLGFHTGQVKGVHNPDKQAASMVAVEIIADGWTGNLRMEHIGNFRADTLKYALKNMLDTVAQIRSDDYCSYQTVKNQ